MTGQQIDRDRLRADIETGKRLTGTIDAGWEEDYYPAMARIFEAVPHLLDQIDQQEAELDSWMTRAYEAEKRAWKAETRLAGWMEHWNATARTGAVDEVAAILEANARADRAEARIRAVQELCDSAPNGEDLDPLSSHYSSGYELALQDIRRALEG